MPMANPMIYELPASFGQSLTSGAKHFITSESIYGQPSQANCFESKMPKNSFVSKWTDDYRLVFFRTVQTNFHATLLIKT